MATIPQHTTIDPDTIITINEEDIDAGFKDAVLKPSTVSEIWATFKVKAAMIKYLTWYFRPKNSYDPERVDYNALNILAEYQCFNLEFCKNELSLSDKQSACVLDMFWSLLEFDPDEKSVERDIEMKVDKEEALQESSLQHPAGKD